jgi:DMSO/TMAO reductase YedYZ molybdopterin-dependent catalytic subunit
MPVTQWLNDRVPRIDPASWAVQVHAGPQGSTRFSLLDLDAMREPVRATIDCTGGWYAEQFWEGVRLDRLLVVDAAEVRSISVRSMTGYARRFPSRDLNRLWLATRVGGSPLSPGHGFPARLVAPGRRGFWWVKWVVEVASSETPWWWQPPFPLT